MATPVRPYAKEEWNSISSRVTGPQSFDQMVWMSLPFENALQRERERQRRQRESGQHTDLSARMDIPTLSPAGVGSPSAPPPLDLSSMTDMVTQLTQPDDRAQLDQEIEDLNLSYPVNVDDAVNLFSLPPVAGTGTAPATTTTQPVTTATQTRHVTSTQTRPVTTTTSSRPRPVTSIRTRPVTTATTTTSPTHPLTARRRAGTGTTTTTTLTVTTPSARPRIAAEQPRRRPQELSPPFPDSSPPPSDDDGDDDDEDRRRGLRRRSDLLNEDAQQRARGRRIRNITHTNTVTTVYEEGGGRPSVGRTSTRTSSRSPPSSPPRRGRGRGRTRGRARGRI